MQPTLHLPLRSSRLTRAALVLWHALPGACLFGAGVTWPVRLGVAAVLCISAWLSWRQIDRWNKHSLCLSGTGQAWLYVAERAPQPVVVLDDSLDLGWMILLHWCDDIGRHARVCVMRDACMQNDWRLLRVWLRWREAERERL